MSGFNKFVKMLTVMVAAVMMVVGLSACNSTPAESIVTLNEADSVAILEAINEADVIRAEKAVFALGDSWEIYADEIFVGEVKGQALYLIGDTYSLFTPDGNLVGSESENFRVINATADIYDYYNNPVGRIEQQVSLLLMKLRIFEGEIREGKVSQKLALSLNAEIENMKGEPEWKIDRALFSFGASVTITRKADETNVEGINALWTALMMNEIYEAQAEQNSGNNG